MIPSPEELALLEETSPAICEPCLQKLNDFRDETKKQLALPEIEIAINRKDK
jgi:hypothetical protein